MAVKSLCCSVYLNNEIIVPSNIIVVPISSSFADILEILKKDFPNKDFSGELVDVTVYDKLKLEKFTVKPSVSFESVLEIVEVKHSHFFLKKTIVGNDEDVVVKSSSINAFKLMMGNVETKGRKKLEPIPESDRLTHRQKLFNKVLKDGDYLINRGFRQQDGVKQLALLVGVLFNLDHKQARIIEAGNERADVKSFPKRLVVLKLK